MRRGLLASLLVTAGISSVYAQPPAKVSARVGTVESATTITIVSSAVELQPAIDKAQPGDTIHLEPGRYQGAFILRKKINPANRYITIKSNRDAILAGTSSFAIRTDVGASFYRVQGLVFESFTNKTGEMLRLGDAENPNLADVPHHIEVINNQFIGGVSGQKRAIAANASDLLIENNRCENIWALKQDSQCIGIWSTPGRITILNNYLEAASEPFLSGGSLPASPAHVPKHIRFEGNYVTHKPEWKGTVDKNIKNLFEAKVVEDLIVRGNTFEGHWPQAQPGWAIVITIASNTTRPEGCVINTCDIRDVIFENNIVRNVSAGINILGHNHDSPSGNLIGLTIRNNLFVIDKDVWGGNGVWIQIGGEPKNVVIENNTVDHDGTSMIASYYGSKWLYDMAAAVPAGPIQGFVFRNNIVKNNNYGLKTPEGNSGVNYSTMFPAAVITNNIIFGAPTSAGYPATNFRIPLADLPKVLDSQYRVINSTYAGIGVNHALLPH
jgi:hypothetical protein